jgi:hypothetical protein
MHSGERSTLVSCPSLCDIYFAFATPVYQTVKGKAFFRALLSYSICYKYDIVLSQSLVRWRLVASLSAMCIVSSRSGSPEYFFSRSLR